ncbi:type I DNA topoisomerase [Candidatus Trichorickettsia mobilis]|uniref:type I DNA topoisomerase n=1 Tax=Candidatus Trichorickettsia mobilis TaxID=1346319 RepID=UPI00293161FF|nr:type I DNA topoisomerase [Candidatus Trichorickettsia mobilis]
MKLVIVESPAKAKTIKKYLGNEFEVIASVGHVRDLPSKTGSVLPEQDFMMKYAITDKASKHITNITNEAAKASAIYLATDPDREGEAISWHIMEIIKEKNIVSSDTMFNRVAFNEITKTAVIAAMANPRKIDINLVNAQQARRALDYLVGFTLSPLLWRKLPGCKSAGRVQSVALRLICEQEDKIEQFKTEEYWDIWFDFFNQKAEAFKARLTHIDGHKLDKFHITNESQAAELVNSLNGSAFSISDIENKQQKRQPPPPFITSSLQQEAARKLGFGAKKTMQIAQKLYEGIDIEGNTIGLITYMRTDGVTMADDAIHSIRKLIQNLFGDAYVPTNLKKYKSKVKNAQEAHEAIRPTDINLTPDQLRSQLDKDHHKLYDLIWKRSMACQMENVVIDAVVATINSHDHRFVARANGSTIKFDGFYRIYREGIDDEQEEEAKILPNLAIGEQLKTIGVNPLQHFTEPPPRYSEASLVKKMEELGIGRPSTYASILSVLQERKYVNLMKKRFIPEPLGRLVTTFLVGYFKKYVEYDFTAALETELDEVAGGQLDWKQLLGNFWQGFNGNISSVSEQKITDIISYIEQSLTGYLFGSDHTSTTARQCPLCKDGQLHLRLGKFGAFLACDHYPECNFKKSLTATNIDSDATQPEQDNNNRLIGQDSITGLDIYLKKGPYGWYVQLGENLSKLEKPKRTPLPSILDPNNLKLEIARKLLNLPLKIGEYPGSCAEIMLGIGKYGPYLKHDNAFCSIPKSLDPFNITIDTAVDIINANKIKNSNKQKTATKKT